MGTLKMTFQRWSIVLAAILFLGLGDAQGAKPFCGDNKCTGQETVNSCPSDCSAGDVCGDNICTSSESCESCSQDCGTCVPPSCNNDNVCNFGEDCSSCPGDCAGRTSGKPSGRFCCGADTCDSGLCGGSCGADTPVCGDGALQYSEACDDGNLDNGDGCSALCEIEPPICGNGVVQTGEECDDGNLINGDGCSDLCQIEAPICGNGTLQTGEECDDGNLNNGDGCSNLCEIEISTPLTPTNQFNVGDSIGEGEAANDSIGSARHKTVWSTGYAGGDSVQSLNERFELGDPTRYYENNSTRDVFFNQAVSGANMSDFVDQAQNIVTAATSTPTNEAGMVTILMGNNDVCAESMSDMLDPADFEAQYRAGLDVLANSPRTASASIHVSSLPAIYWLWEAKRSNLYCRLLAWPFVPCQNLLKNPEDDCDGSSSREDPDNVHSGDGPNCIRRKQFHAAIRDDYNPILQDVLAEYRTNGKLPYSEYIDIFDMSFKNSYINDGDCFHPSEEGHAVMAEKHWCRSQWGAGDALCSP